MKSNKSNSSRKMSCHRDDVSVISTPPTPPPEPPLLDLTKPPPLDPPPAKPVRNYNLRRLGRKKNPRGENQPAILLIPPFSPTYCKPNEFPYSNFYLKLPNGRWMLRYRSGTRHIIGTQDLEGYMI
jgi:hypothetical protein